MTAVATPCVAAFGCFLLFGQTQWKIHDMDRPQPRVIEPATASTQEQPGRPPSDAIVLFDGKDLSQWRGKDNEAAKWKVENNYMETVKGTGMIWSRQPFGDCQLHIEWRTPTPAVGESQGRGNSGVYLMGTYEIQVLDSYDNKTYPDGQAGAVYGQFPPLVNASRKPGEWQTYDAIFRGPRFDSSGQAAAARPRHAAAQRRAGPGKRRALGPDRTQRSARVQGASGQAAIGSPGSRQSGSVPEYLDP